MIVDRLTDIPSDFKRKNLSGNVEFAGKYVPTLTFNNLLLPQWYQHEINQKVNLTETLTKISVTGNDFTYKLRSPISVTTWVDIAKNRNNSCDLQAEDERQTITLPGNIKWYLYKDNEFILIRNSGEETQELWVKGGKQLKENITWAENGVMLNTNSRTKYWIIPEFYPLGCWRNRFHSAMCVGTNINDIEHEFCQTCSPQNNGVESCCCC